MNYLCYDLFTGKITETGWVDEEYVDNLMAQGKPTLLLDYWVDYRTNKVDLATKKVVALSEQELALPILPPPIVVGTPILNPDQN